MGVRLEDLGVIGDMESLALVDRAGDVVWCCWPRFDSPSIFGSLLDPDGGTWSLRPLCDEQSEPSRQLYVAETNVLVTRFHTASGIVEVEDLMAVAERRAVIRRVRCLRGTVSMCTSLDPRPDFGRSSAQVTGGGDRATIVWSDGRLTLLSDAPLRVDGRRVTADFELAEGTTAVFALTDDSPSDDGDLVGSFDRDVDRTIDFWRTWTERGTYRGRWREAVERSALVLKLLTHRPTGGTIAAGTTSLPEHLGGERNWDYRYVWIRDAAFTVYAFVELGHHDEADAFAAWLVRRLDGCTEHDPPLAALYDLDGERDIPEHELDHWAGYEDSRPVRVGNGAAGQRQLDIYGELIDSLYLIDKRGDGLSLDTWEHVRTLVDHVIDRWSEPDQGMWEPRSEPERHTSSLLMCWVAVERAIRMARHRGRPADLDRWRGARDEMHETLLERGWSSEIGAFTRTLDGDDVDASILLAPLVKFVPGDDPRWTSTLAILRERLAHGPLVDRYDTAVVDDGLAGGEGSFLICSFWLVEALSRAGRIDEARGMFDRLLTYAGPLGLFSEQVGPTGRQLGNFPQAFTHLALISAAIHLDEALDERRR